MGKSRLAGDLWVDRSSDNSPVKLAGRHDSAGGDNVFDAGPARQIADRFCETLQERPNRSRAAQPLRKLVSYIAGIEIRKNKHVCVSCDRALLLYFFLRDIRYQRRVDLKFSVNYE